MKICKEIWKDIPDYVELDQASTFGRVKSLERVIMRKNGSFLPIKEKILKPQISAFGYFQMQLHKEGNHKNFYIHQLILLTFKGNSSLDCNHIDCNKLNNNLENLEYITHKENIRHAWRNGRMENIRNRAKKGIYEKKINQLNLNNNFIQTFDSGKEASKKLKISTPCISACLHGIQKTAGNFKWEFCN